MCACATAKRRRSQARNGNRHLAKLGRPVYKKTDTVSAARRLRAAIEKQKLIAMRRGMSKK